MIRQQKEKIKMWNNKWQWQWKNERTSVQYRKIECYTVKI